jgi:hypothetical protein
MFNDIFRQDAFSLTSLTAAINEQAFTPSLISSMGLFQEEGISTLDCAIEFEKGVIHLVPVVPRGAPGYSPTQDKRRVYSFRVPHLPQSQGLMADQVQGVRQFGSEDATETIERRRDKLLAKMRRAIDYTIEAHRLSAIKGLMYDANGGTTDLYTLFGVAQATVAMALPTATTKVRQKCLEVIEKVETGLDGIPYTGLEAVCGKDFWKELIDHAAVKDTYLNWQAAAELRGKPTTAFEYGGIVWNRYRGTTDVKVADDDALVAPKGVDEMFITRFAPANYVETVNTDGLPYYAKAELMKMGKGVEIESQSNPLNINTRPLGVIRLTKV